MTPGAEFMAGREASGVDPSCDFKAGGVALRHWPYLASRVKAMSHVVSISKVALAFLAALLIAVAGAVLVISPPIWIAAFTYGRHRMPDAPGHDGTFAIVRMFRQTNYLSTSQRVQYSEPLRFSFGLFLSLNTLLA